MWAGPQVQSSVEEQGPDGPSHDSSEVEFLKLITKPHDTEGIVGLRIEA
jgi:hypothetical protein